MNPPREIESVPIHANCMQCGVYRLCCRIVDIGWVCLECLGVRK